MDQPKTLNFIMLMTARLSQLRFISVERLLAEGSRTALSRHGRVFVSVVDAAIDKIEIVDFGVAWPDIIRVLILL